jgi:hypothetical protein
MRAIVLTSLLLAERAGAFTPSSSGGFLRHRAAQQPAAWEEERAAAMATATTRRRRRFLPLRSSMMPPENDDDDDAEADERFRRAAGGGKDGSMDDVFDISSTPEAIIPIADYSEPRSDNGTRSSEFDGLAELTEQEAERNPFTGMVSRLSSTDTIGKFMRDAPPRVQEAMKTTVMGLLGNMKPFAVDTNAVTTSENLANLMFQLQMTGYMFKNADYRLSLRQSLTGAMDRFADKIQPEGGADGGDGSSEKKRVASSEVEVEGKIKVTFEDGSKVEVDADAYMAELRGEVEKLRGDLVAYQDRRDAREAALSADLVAYINSMPKEEMLALTNDVSPEVLQGMEELVYGILKQFGVTDGERIMLDSSDAMSKLCMWQLVIGYNLREYEVREQFKKQLSGATAEGADTFGGSASLDDDAEDDSMDV